MTEPPPPQGATTTAAAAVSQRHIPQLPAAPPPAASGSSPAAHGRTRARQGRADADPAQPHAHQPDRGRLGLVVAVIFIIQNVHAVNISFLGVHLCCPWPEALLLAAIAGSLLTVAAGPARITRVRQIMRRGLGKALMG